MTPIRFALAVVILSFVPALEAGAQCWRFDVQCCRCCDGFEDELDCSVCMSGFMCCPVPTTNGVTPEPTPPSYLKGYLVEDTEVSSTSVWCIIRAKTPVMPECVECEWADAWFYHECITWVLPPAFNCPPGG